MSRLKCRAHSALLGILFFGGSCSATSNVESDTAPVAAIESRKDSTLTNVPVVSESLQKDLTSASIAEDFLTSIISLAEISKKQKGKLDADTKKRLTEVTTYVDVIALSRRSLGARWSSIPKHERNEFIKTLTEVLEQVVYPQAVKISAKSDEFVYKHSPKEPKFVHITGSIEREKLGEILSNPFSMRLEFDLKTKKIVDAVIENEPISANLKRQFDRALEKRNFAAIIELMKKRVVTAKQEAGRGGV